MREHFSAISEYAKAYATMERLQRRKGDALFPIGDQKTGVIAEFFGRLYAADRYRDSQLVYGTPSEHAWDITVRRPNAPDRKIQVKAVSAHARKSRISPIHPGWHELYLMRLSAEFLPIGFWVLDAAKVSWSSRKLGSPTMPKANEPGSGSAAFAGAVDELAALQRVLARAQA
jgi:hypothetical protein